MGRKNRLLIITKNRFTENELVSRRFGQDQDTLRERDERPARRAISRISRHPWGGDSKSGTGRHLFCVVSDFHSPVAPLLRFSVEVILSGAWAIPTESRILFACILNTLRTACRLH